MRMGCGSSSRQTSSTIVPDSMKEEPKTKKLSSCRLEFNPRQLQYLNYRFYNMLDYNHQLDPSRDKTVKSLSVVVERLVQRILCGVGSLDSRFATKFLISLDTSKQKREIGRNRLKFRYLVRLDSLSTPPLYPQHNIASVKIVDGYGTETLPQGYAKIRLAAETLEEWSEFVNHHGYLRRDKIQDKFVELLAKSASKPVYPTTPLDVDESRLCGSPGKVVDSFTLHTLLSIPPEHQFYFGPAECNETRFPDPRDFRIAIVEGAPDTKLHVSFLSPTANSLTAEEDIEVVLTLGINVSNWPASADFPSRYPLDHTDCLLAYQAAQTGCYLVTCGPHSSINCEDRTSVWEIRTPAAESIFDQHYCDESVVRKVEGMLQLLLVTLKSRGVKSMNRYLLKVLLYFELERSKNILEWAPVTLSGHVLSVMDNLLNSLKNQQLRSFMFDSVNLLLQDGLSEEDFVSDAEILEYYLNQLYHEGLNVEEMSYFNTSYLLETAIVRRWQDVILNLSPPSSTRGRRISTGSSSVNYTSKQIEYISILFREMLKVKQLTDKKKELTYTESTAKTDLLFLLNVIFEQAKQQYVNQNCDKLKRRNKEKVKLNQVLDSYDVSTAILMENLKCEIKEVEWKNDSGLVTQVIQCLYKGMDSDTRVIGLILRPYVSQLFKGSHENCWFLNDWTHRTDHNEFEAIGAFCKLVMYKNISPLDGIIDSAEKGWNWAKNTLHLIQDIAEETSAGVIIGEKVDISDSGLRLIFTPEPGRTIRQNVKLDNLTWQKQLQQDETRTTSTATNKGNKTKTSDTNQYSTIRSFPEHLYAAVNGLSRERREDCTWERTLNESTIKKLRNWCEKGPPHITLRETSPLTQCAQSTHRRGTHRGLGNIIQALITLRKLSVLQEISQLLPEEDRHIILNDLQKLSKEVNRLSVSNYRRRLSLPMLDCKNRFSFKRSNRNRPTSKSATLPTKKMEDKTEQGEEVYRATDEFTTLSREKEMRKILQDREVMLDRELDKAREESLIGTCRIARRQRQSVTEPNVLQRTDGVVGGRSFVTARNTTKQYSCHTLPSSVLRTPFNLRVTSHPGPYSSQVSDI